MSTVVSMVAPNGPDDGEQRRKLLADRLADPEVADSLMSLLDHADLVAILVEGVDGILRRGDDLSNTLIDAMSEARATLTADDSPFAGINADEVKDAARSAVALAKQAGPLLAALADSGAVNAGTVGAAGRLAGALGDADATYSAGMSVPSAWGIARALRDRNVRSGLAYLLEVARSLGASNGQAPPNHAVSRTDSSTTTQRGVR
ncbi:hypothetical protein GOPIP_030_00040 [Gordonia polyisoprenivorans NBRC 16320 = JCM 10675]|nr:DUF1641 domain-containing protein [Gordonia polyisoprenivorans]WCB37593.1 DUF1641 domain-containing protein [Gordonia polyisoprenivorans]GAB22334.1 hypothetical protein GOPIP_030_00040 [Gordonia polyisoprenivorans NBRC 16320 = JCM 10675]